MEKDEFLNYVLDSLSRLSYLIRTRKMFGGYGLYISGKIFAIIADNELYLKSSANDSDFFVQNGSEKFSYERNGKIVKMSYWKVHEEVLEEPEILKQWVNIATNSKPPLL